MEFRKDLQHVSWQEVFSRQQQRAALIPAWLEGLHLSEGCHVLDLGSGPGYVSLQIAQRIRPSGMVYAIDHSAEALRYLQALMQQDAVTNIRCFSCDILTFSPGAIPVSAILLSMLLHHSNDPQAIIKKLAHLLPLDAPAVIAEFHPDGPALTGPPQSARLAPDLVTLWCRTAGLDVVSYLRQSDEHYMFVVCHSEKQKAI